MASLEREFVETMQSRLVYTISEIAAAHPRGGSTFVSSDPSFLDRAYFGSLKQSHTSAVIALQPGDMIVVDNRRHSHAVLPYIGLRQNAVGMISTELCRPAILRGTMQSTGIK